MAKRKEKDQLPPVESTEASDTSPAMELVQAAPQETNETLTRASQETPAQPDETRSDWQSRTQRDESPRDEPERKPSYPDPNIPFPIAHDNEAGVHLLKFDRYKQVQLGFSAPTSDDVDRRLVESGWKYRPEEKVYTKQYGEHGAGAAMVEAKRLYDNLVQDLLDEKGLGGGHSR